LALIELDTRIGLVDEMHAPREIGFSDRQVWNIANAVLRCMLRDVCFSEKGTGDALAQHQFPAGRLWRKWT
jgi:hypothetical protein